jgi:hypothetical protein
VPWCDPCERFWTPGRVGPSNECPVCHSQLTEGQVAATARESAAEAEEAPSKISWHFWVFVAIAAVYLGWRAVQGVVWLVAWIS